MASKLRDDILPGITLRDLFLEILESEKSMRQSIRIDLEAVKDRDPAANGYLTPFLFYKGFHALSAYRFAHHLWYEERKTLALYLQSLISTVFGVDIHPAATIGHGILIDHATGVVIGETAVVGNNVSLLHGVTLGGTGKGAWRPASEGRGWGSHCRGSESAWEYQDWRRGQDWSRERGLRRM